MAMLIFFALSDEKITSSKVSIIYVHLLKYKTIRKIIFYTHQIFTLKHLNTILCAIYLGSFELPVFLIFKNIKS